MTKEINFVDGSTVVPAAWLNSMQEVLSNYASSCVLQAGSSNSLRLARTNLRPVLGSQEYDDGGILQEITAGIVVEGRLCTFATTPTYSMVGKASGNYTVWATNNGTDHVVAIEAQRIVGLPTLVPSASKKRLIGYCVWDGTSLGDVYSFVGIQEDGPASIATARSIGSGATQVVAGNDPRLSAGLTGIKPPVVAVHGTNVNLANPGTFTYGGIICNPGERVLLYGQTSNIDNGIYIIGAHTYDPLVRAPDMAAGSIIAGGCIVPVSKGTGGIDNSIWNERTADTSLVVGTDPQTWGFLAGSATVTSAMAANISFDNSATKLTSSDVQSALAEIFPFRVVAVATTNINLGVLPPTIDGVTMNTGDLFLCTNQTTASQNGLQKWTSVGGVAVRPSGFNTGSGSGQVVGGHLVAGGVAGTSNGGVWQCTNTGAITVGTTSITYNKIAGPNSVDIAKVAASLKPSGTAATTDEALRALGTTAGTAAAGNDSRITGAAKSTDIQTFTANGIWNKPAGMKAARVIMIGGGGGGGGGRRGAAGSERYGGNGGGGGGALVIDFLAADLSASMAVVIGAGGSGGAGRSTDSTNGGIGGDGGQTAFGTFGTDPAFIQTGYGGGGLGGTGVASGVSGGTGGLGQFAPPYVGTPDQSNATHSTGGSGGQGGLSTVNATPTYGGSAFMAPSGGATGSCITAGNTQNGAYTGGTVRSAAPVVGRYGVGGSGGGAGLAGAATAGSVGGNYGAGGGGGGASTNGFASGAGGAGAPGLCIVISYF